MRIQALQIVMLPFFLFFTSCLCAPGPSLVGRQAQGILSASMDQLVALRSNVSGRLYHGTPSSLYCFANYNNGQMTSPIYTDDRTDSGHQCAPVRENYHNGSFISSNFGGYMTPDFSTCITTDRGCMMPMNGTASVAPTNETCYQGSVPNYYIDAQEISDIQAGLKFASTTKMPIVVKNTGHDYSGRSSGANTLAIWLRHYRPALQHYDSFVPQGCADSAGTAISVPAGYQFGDAQQFANQYNETIISGVAQSVGGSGGWTIGGGHSALSPKWGLGVDNVLQMKAVLPNGTEIVANRCQNQDMFFALRGGGGNAFGIVVETTYIARKKFPVQSVKMNFNFENKVDVVNVLTTHAEQLNRDGWGLYIDVLNGTMNADGIIPYVSLEEARASLKPITDFAFTQQNLQLKFESHASYWDFLESPLGQFRGSVAIGVSFVVSSRLLPKSLFESESERQKLNEALSSQDFLITTVGPAFVELPASDQPGGPGQASITPAWRDSLWFIMLRAQWDSGIPADTVPSNVVSNIEKNNVAIQKLRDLTPNGGTYFNEAHPYEPNAGATFWGEANYERLSKIKSEIDPDNILTCWQCVGYDPNDARFGCYPKL